MNAPGSENIIDGKAFATALREQVARHVEAVKNEHGITPGLAVVLVGENPASQVYVRNKAKMTVEVGMQSFEHKLDASTSQEELLALVDKLNKDAGVNGILVQLPVPDQIDPDAVIEAIDPAKDVDGFHVINAGRLFTGAGEALVPCTPYGCLLMLRDRLGDLSGKKAVIVGRSNIVGKPMAHLLLGENCTVEITHSRTQNLAEECRTADILVAAVGRPKMIKGDWIKPGAAVIDVGINRIEPEQEGAKARLVGDVDFEEAVKVAGHITPVPGGVGPMTIACLLRNTLVATCRQKGLSEPGI